MKCNTLRCDSKMMRRIYKSGIGVVGVRVQLSIKVLHDEKDLELVYMRKER